MQNQTQKLTLQWFLDFIHVDLNQISIGEKMKLISEALTICYGFGPWLFSERAVVNILPWQRFEEEDGTTMLPDPWYDKEALEKSIGYWLKEDKLSTCQKRLKSFYSNFTKRFNAVVNNIVKRRQSYFELMESLSLGHENFKNISIYLGIPLEKTVLIDDEVKEEDVISEEEVDEVDFADMDLDKIELDDRTRFYLETLMSTPLILSLRSSTEEDTLLLYFYIALQAISISPLKKCSECGTPYVHITKRKRIFCSPQCAMRKANREKRKHVKEHAPDEYEKEKAAGRKRAKKSDRKKKKK